MRKNLIFLFIATTLFGCKKDKVEVPTPINTNYYQSNGNLLILEIGEIFENAYEYNLSAIQLNNDSIPISIETESNQVTNFSYWKLLPNPDTLFWSSSNDFKFMTNNIEENKLKILNNSITYDSAQFQFLGSQNNTNYSSIWSKVSNLEIVKTYRNSLPNSKIGISRVVINEYNEQLGVSTPVEKYFLFLVK